MKIYHYTTIETLALILKNRTLRFNNISNVNDPDECITEDLGSLQPYCFVSCWTKQPEESIPFWQIYANNGHGVRLESDTGYIHFRNTSPVARDVYHIVSNVIKENDDSFFKILYQEQESDNHYFITNYSDEKRIFERDCSTPRIQQWIHDYESAFNTKKKCWSFENEVRFILLGCRCEKYPEQTIINNILNKEPFSDKDVFLCLEQDFFDNLIITSGPKTTEAEKIIIQSLIRYFGENQKIQIQESKIKMR